MPHCGRRLYSNLLCANWGPELRNVILIGNSFDHYVLRALSKEKLGRYISIASEFVKETPLTNDVGMRFVPF